METPLWERLGMVIVNLLLMVAGFCLGLCLFSCGPTYQRCFDKYGRSTTTYDTTRHTIRDTVTVPRDSVVLVLKTDTTRVIEHFTQGKATVTIIREPTNTTVLANCESTTIIREIKLPPTAITDNTWGVANWYKWAFWMVAGMVLVLLLVWYLTTRLAVSVTRKL